MKVERILADRQAIGSTLRERGLWIAQLETGTDFDNSQQQEMMIPQRPIAPHQEVSLVDINASMTNIFRSLDRARGQFFEERYLDGLVCFDSQGLGLHCRIAYTENSLSEDNRLTGIKNSLEARNESRKSRIV